MLRPNEIVIGDHNGHLLLTDQVVDGDTKSRGLIPRNFWTHPAGYLACAPALAVDFPVIPRSEWPDRIKDKIAAKSQLSDIRLTGNNGQIIPSLDQNGKGYCWAHSSTTAVMMVRAVANEPYVPLSAYAVACIIKNYQDQGGWGAESLDFITSRGVPSQAFWPQQSMDRANDKPETWANAALHKVVQEWADLNVGQYDRTMTFDQECTLYLTNTPGVKDENWWSHSICGLDVVDGVSMRDTFRMESGKLAEPNEFDEVWGVNTVAAGFGVRILNSWGDSWSDRGMGVLTGNKAISDGFVAPRVTVPSGT